MSAIDRNQRMVDITTHIRKETQQNMVTARHGVYQVPCAIRKALHLYNREHQHLDEQNHQITETSRMQGLLCWSENSKAKVLVFVYEEVLNITSVCLSHLWIEALWRILLEYV